MKTIAVREGKNHFGDLVDQARTQPILVEHNGRRAVVVMAPEEYDELLAVQDALWEARAMAIVMTSEPLAVEDGVKLLKGFVATA